MEKLIEAVANALRVSCQQRFDRTWSHDTAEAFARAALAAIEASGTHVVVPVETTREMARAGSARQATEIKAGGLRFEASASEIYDAMIAARPKVTP